MEYKYTYTWSIDLGIVFENVICQMSAIRRHVNQLKYIQDISLWFHVEIGVNESN